MDFDILSSFPHVTRKRMSCCEWVRAIKCVTHAVAHLCRLQTGTVLVNTSSPKGICLEASCSKIKHLDTSHHACEEFENIIHRRLRLSWVKVQAVIVSGYSARGRARLCLWKFAHQIRAKTPGVPLRCLLPLIMRAPLHCCLKLLAVSKKNK